VAPTSPDLQVEFLAKFGLNKQCEHSSPLSCDIVLQFVLVLKETKKIASLGYYG
jgi:hypothetical protein